MKLILQNDRIAGAATDDYTGPEVFIDAPEDFDPAQLDRYRVVDGALVIPAPASISRAQGKTALILAGLWPSVLAAVAAIEDATQKQLAEVALHDAGTWERTSPTLNALAYGLGMDDAQLDALFTDAAGVVL